MPQKKKTSKPKKPKTKKERSIADRTPLLGGDLLSRKTMEELGFRPSLGKVEFPF